jgi:formamidopyrimidine-DNA glycosylase
VPEGPEVKTFTDSLQFIVNHQLQDIIVTGGRFSPQQFNYVSLPLIVQEVNCKGKLIYWKFSNDLFMLNSLGMTGSWSLSPNNYTHVIFQFNNDMRLYFNDIRHFGTIKFVSNKDFIKKMKSLGPDMLSNPPNNVNFSLLFNKDINITKFLMDQKHLSGVGNYIKSEALYRSKISPHRKANSLSELELSNLRQEIIVVMQQSYSLQGATLSNYYTLNKEEGKFSEFLQVYGKQKDPLGNSITKETTLDGRSTWWVKNIQR